MGVNTAIKRLAGQTAIYGMSSVVARILNFLLVPLYTYLLKTPDYGVISNFMAYVAIFQVVLTLGLETGCFWFAQERQKQKQNTQPVFSTALSTVGLASLAFFALSLLLNRQIADLLDFDGQLRCLGYVCASLLLDCVCAIWFARLRFEEKAFRFALFKILKISVELGANLFFFLIFPRYAASHPHNWLLHFISPTPDYTYNLFAIFLSCVACFFLFVPQLLRRGSLRIDRKLWPQMMAYSLPLMIAGLPGIMNDMVDRILFRFCLPAEAWKAQLGIYAACVKLSVLIQLFIQMFRYAADAFYFKNKDLQKDGPKLFAQVLDYFTAFCVFIGLGILLFMDLLQYFIGPDFRQGIKIVPLMLLAYIFLGIYYNVSMWYKLSGKTRYAIVITLLSLPFTLCINLFFLPRLGYAAAAWGHLVSYGVMLLSCIWLGRKHYPIPYRWGKIGLYLAVGGGLYALSLCLPPMGSLVAKLGVHSLFLLAFAAFFVLLERQTARR